MIRKLKYFFDFYFNSTNQYSVHSPLVFNLITKCIYLKKKESLLNPNILVKILSDYFHDKNDDKYNIIYLKNISSHNDKLQKQLSIARNVIIVIDKNELYYNYSEWIKLINGSKSQISINFYYFGILIFRRKKLYKQNYKIRL